MIKCQLLFLTIVFDVLIGHEHLQELKERLFIRPGEIVCLLFMRRLKQISAHVDNQTIEVLGVLTSLFLSDNSLDDSMGKHRILSHHLTDKAILPRTIVIWRPGKQ